MKETKGDKTREKILEAGVKLWPHVTLQSIASLTGMTHPAILYHFPDGTIKGAVAEYAVKIGESRVIVALMAEKHPAVLKLPAADRIRHFNAI
jgi:AcrR family transcriptional regulator